MSGPAMYVKAYRKVGWIWVRIPAKLADRLARRPGTKVTRSGGPENPNPRPTFPKDPR